MSGSGGPALDTRFVPSHVLWFACCPALRRSALSFAHAGTHAGTPHYAGGGSTDESHYLWLRGRTIALVDAALERERGRELERKAEQERAREHENEREGARHRVRERGQAHISAHSGTTDSGARSDVGGEEEFAAAQVHRAEVDVSLSPQPSGLAASVRHRSPPPAASPYRGRSLSTPPSSSAPPRLLSSRSPSLL